jgi:maleate isomerase/arylmalonate decarboxylase
MSVIQEPSQMSGADRRHRSAYGPRGRIGLVVPPTNTVNEAEWRLMMPDGVSFHTHRMPLHLDHGDEAGRARLMADLDAAFGMLTPVRPDAVAYACTAGSMVEPVSALPQALTATHGVPAVTTAAAVIDALKALGARRIAVATPYSQAMNAAEAAFLRANGFHVAAIAGLGIGEGGPADFVRIAETPIETVESLARTTFAQGCDALAILCTDFPTLPLIDRLERDLGAPVVTSNQATLWAALRAAGLEDRPQACGQLLKDR